MQQCNSNPHHGRSGARLTLNVAAVEHTEQDLTLWNGERGQPRPHQQPVIPLA